MATTPKHQTTPTKPPLPPATVARPSCASCKHQRRRCSRYCPLAPYFPANKQREFRNVHRLFGVHYVVKLLESVAPHHCDDAVRSLIYEANVRADNPVGGCFAIIRDLHSHIVLCNTQLQFVAKNLAFQRARFLHSFDDDRKLF